MNKSPDAFRTISEVADELDLPQHVLRFWETRFNQIKPMKRGGGRRYYRPEDVELLSSIKTLLYKEGYTIRGVQRLLKEQGTKLTQPIEPEQSDVVTMDVPPTMASGERSVNEASQSAMNVEEFARQNAPKKAKSILNRLTEIVGVDDDENASIDKNDIGHLKNTLQELLECKRLLDQTRQD